MAQWVRVIAAMSDGLSLILRTHKVGGGEELIPMSCPQTFTLVSLHAASKTEVHSYPKTLYLFLSGSLCFQNTCLAMLQVLTFLLYGTFPGFLY